MMRWAIRAVLVVIPLLGWWSADFVPGQEARLPTADDVKELQAKFQAERDRVLQEGIQKRFLPGLVEKADEMAKRADSALANRRFLQASEALRQARWQLPYQSPQVPDQVARVLGNLRLRHAHEVFGVAYSPDGARLATASRDRTVKIWDLANGHEMLTYTGHGDQVRFVAFNPNGKSIASAGADKDILVWDPVTGKTLLTIKGPGLYVTGLAYTRDGKHLIAAYAAPAGQNGALLAIHDTAKGETRGIISDHFRVNINGLNLNAENTVLAAGVGDGFMHLWDLPKLIENPKTPPYWSQQNLNGASYQVVISPDNKTLARVGPDSLQLFNMILPGMPFQIANPRLTIPLPQSRPGSPVPVRFTCVLFSKDNKTLFTGATDGVIRLYDVESGAPGGTFKGHNADIRALVFNGAGSQLASASSDFTVRLWDFDIVLQARDFIGHDGPAWTSAFSPDGTRLVSASADKSIKIWDVAGGTVVKTLTGHQGSVTCAQYSPDGLLIASGGGDKNVVLWDAKSGDKVKTLAGHDGAITALDFSPTGKFLVSGGADKKVKIWSLDKGKDIEIDIPSVVGSLAVRHDGQQIAVGSIDQMIRLFDPEGKALTKWSAHGIAVTGLSYSPDGQSLASCGADGLGRIWYFNQAGAPLPAKTITLTGHLGPLNAISFRKDGQHLVTAGSDQVVKLWKLENDAAKEAQNYRGHKDWITSAAFSRDGFYVISSGVDRTLKIWEITSREIPLLAEHTGSVDAVAVSPDGKWIASAASDKTIKIWDRATGAERFSMPALADTILSLAFTGDSKTLVSSAIDRNFRLWDVASGKEIPRNPGQQASFSGLLQASPLLFIPPGGKQLLAWVPNNTRGTNIVGWDLDSGNELFNLLDGGPKGERNIGCLSFSLDGKLVATGAADGSIRVWDLDKKAIQTDLTLFAKGVGISDLSFTLDNGSLIVASNEGEVKICKLANKEVSKTFKAHPGRLAACLISPHGKTFATLGFDNVIKLWDLDGKELRVWDLKATPQDRGTFVHGLAFTPDSKQLVAGNANTTIYILDLP